MLEKTLNLDNPHLEHNILSLLVMERWWQGSPNLACYDGDIWIRCIKERMEIICLQSGQLLLYGVWGESKIHHLITGSYTIKFCYNASMCLIQYNSASMLWNGVLVWDRYGTVYPKTDGMAFHGWEKSLEDSSKARSIYSL